MESAGDDEDTQENSDTRAVVSSAACEPVAQRTTNPSIAAAEQLLRRRIDKFLAGYGLTPMGKAVALRWIQQIGADVSGDYARVRGWLLGQLNAFSKPEGASLPSSDGISPWQRGCPELIPGLRSKAFWDAQDLPWIVDFQKGFPDVREELLALRGRGGFQPYRAPRGHGSSTVRPAADGVGSHCNDRGEWNVFYLFLHNVDFAQNRSMCPKTCALVKTLPRHYHHAFFSALAPGTHIVKHHGPTNKKVRIHLPLLAPAGGLSRLRVGSETRETQAGRALIFDDSFEHEAWNDGYGDGAGDSRRQAEATVRSAAGGLASGVAQRGTSWIEEKGKKAAWIPQSEREPCPLPVENAPAGDREGWRAPLVGGERGGSIVPRDGRSSRETAEKGEGVKQGEREPGARAAPRVTLIVDIWHPDLFSGEVRFLAFLQQAALQLEKRFVERKKAEMELPVINLRSPKRYTSRANSDSERVERGPEGRPRQGQGAIALPPRAITLADKPHPSQAEAMATFTPTIYAGNTSSGSDTLPEVRAGDVSGDPGDEEDVGCSAVEGVGVGTAERSIQRIEEGISPLGTKDHERDCSLVQTGDNFLGVITRARQLQPHDSSIFGEVDGDDCYAQDR